VEARHRVGAATLQLATQNVARHAPIVPARPPGQRRTRHGWTCRTVRVTERLFTVTVHD
jgi:hypothetical protein